MKILFASIAAGLAMAQSPVVFEAKHEHLRGACAGRLTVDPNGVAFESAKKEDHSWRWGYLDIQQIKVLDNGEVSLLTYEDNKWRLGADREFHFKVADRRFASEAGPLLESRLERRFISGVQGGEWKPFWEVPVKHLLRFSGSEGTLLFGEGRIEYRTPRPGDSRTWLFSDIDSISTSGPYELTITTYERARSHYGDRKGFNFQLKEALREDRYNDLWRRLEKSKGVQILCCGGS